ncbi:MAG: hypothetical protein ACOX50_00100 [Patescibacteria group bacterium]
MAIIIVLAYMLLRFFRLKSLAWDTIIYTAAALLILSSTGSLASPFFFLLYFLLFAAALLFEPFFTLTLSLALAIFFFRELNSLQASLQILSLVFFTPLAIYFGSQYLKLLENKKAIKLLTKKGQKLEKEIGNQETQSLLWLSLDLKNGLLSIIHQASELLADNRLPLGKSSRDSLHKIHKTAKDLLESGQKLQEAIDKQTD